MAGPVSQSESQNYYKRLSNLASAMQGIYEEAKRLDSERVTFTLGTNLDADSSAAGLTVQNATDFFTGPLADFVTFYENGSVTADATRRDTVNVILAAEPFL